MNVRADRQLPLFIFLIVVLCWLVPGLVGHEPWKPDEGYTFGLVSHIAATGDWVVPTLAGEPFMEKPPLYFMVAAGFLKLLGGILNPPDAARLASAFFLILAFIPVALSARDLHGRGYGRWAVLALIGCVGLAVRAHQMITDTALFAGTAWGIYGYIIGLRRLLAGSIMLGVGAAIAFLSKGLLGPGLLGACGVLLPLFGREFRTLRYAGFLLVALLIFLPLPAIWMLALYRRAPDLFHVWFWDNNIGRFSGASGLGPKSGRFFYFTLLPWYAIPALPLALAALWRQRGCILPANWRVPLAFFLGGFVVLSVASDARELYAMPLLPSLAILAAGAIRFHLAPGKFWRVLWLLVFGLLALAIWAFGIALAYGEPTALSAWLTAKAPGLAPHGSETLLLLGLGVTLLMVRLVFSKQEGRLRPLFVWTAGFSLCWALVMILGMPFLDYTKRYADPFLALRAHLPAEGCVASIRLGEPQRALLDYYASLRTLRTEVHADAAKCAYVLVQSETGQSEIKPAGELLWKGGRAGDTKEWYALYRLR